MWARVGVIKTAARSNTPADSPIVITSAPFVQVKAMVGIPWEMVSCSCHRRRPRTTTVTPDTPCAIFGVSGSHYFGFYTAVRLTRSDSRRQIRKVWIRAKRKREIAIARGRGEFGLLEVWKIRESTKRMKAKVRRMAAVKKILLVGLTRDVE